jgi:hypothetical protein
MLHLPPYRALSSSVPGWVLPGFSGGIDLDFANRRAFGASLAQVSCSRASAAYGDDADGNWSLFSANAPVITNKGLQVFEASTNQIRNNSMQGAATGAPGTAPTNWAGFNSTFNGVTRTIAAIGTDNGVDYIEFNYSGTATATSSLNIFFEQQTQIAAALGDTWAASCFCTLAGGTLGDLVVRLLMRENDGSGNTLVSGNTIITPAAGALGKARYTFARTLTNASTACINASLQLSFTSGSSYNFTLRLGWPQLELKVFSTSPIRTTNAAATRNADVITLPASGFGAAATLCGAGTPLAPASYGTNQILLSLDDGASNALTILRGSVNGYAISGATAGPQPQGTEVWAQGVRGKLAFATQSGDGAKVFNGNAAITGSASGFPAALTALHLGSNRTGGAQFTGYIDRLAVARARLANSILQGITA